MPIVMHFALGVNRTLSKRHFDVVVSVLGVWQRREGR
jgi:hypothetical protein